MSALESNIRRDKEHIQDMHLPVVSPMDPGDFVDAFTVPALEPRPLGEVSCRSPEFNEETFVRPTYYNGLDDELTILAGRSQHILGI